MNLKTFSHNLTSPHINVWPLTDIFISIVLGGFLSYGYWNRKDPFWVPLYVEDGIFEWATFYLFIVAAIFFFIASYLSYRSDSVGRKYFYWYLFFAFCVILIAGEEISWGQRIFNWQTPVWMYEINLQNETNAHNLVKIGKWYPYISVCLVLLLFTGKKWLEPKNPEFYARIFPPISQWLLAVIIFIWTVFLHQGEIVEEIAAVWSVMFSMYIIRTVIKHEKM